MWFLLNRWNCLNVVFRNWFVTTDLFKKHGCFKICVIIFLTYFVVFMVSFRFKHYWSLPGLKALLTISISFFKTQRKKQKSIYILEMPARSFNPIFWHFTKIMIALSVFQRGLVSFTILCVCKWRPTVYMCGGLCTQHPGPLCTQLRCTQFFVLWNRSICSMYTTQPNSNNKKMEIF